jgi:tetratricopeptide (TPR) repeat protein
MMRKRAAFLALPITALGMLALAAPALADMTFSPGVGLAIDAEHALKSDKPEKSIQLGEKAIKSMDLPPTFSAYVWNNMCVAYAEITRFEMAIYSCDKALKFDEDDWRFLNNRGNALLGMGLADEAIEAYTKGLKDHPDNGVLQQNLEIAQKYKRFGGIPLSFSQRPLRL